MLVSNGTEAVRPQPPKLYICGTGVRIPGHLTVETMGILQGCSRIFSPLSGPTRGLLPAHLADRLEGIEPTNTESRLDPSNPCHWVERILSSALLETPVAYLTYGNPIIHDPLTDKLMRGAKERGISADLRPAISSIDALLVELNLDLSRGLQIFDAHTFALNQTRPRRDLPCILNEPCSNNRGALAPGADTRAWSLHVLRDHLLRCYSPHHEVMFVVCAAIGRESITEVRAIHDLCNAGKQVQVTGAALYIPPVTDTIENVLSVNAAYELASLPLAPRKSGFQA